MAIRRSRCLPDACGPTENRAGIRRCPGGNPLNRLACEWSLVSRRDSDPVRSADAQFDCWFDRYERAKLVELPIVREAIGWLRANLIATDRLVLCHGDYRIGNFMVRNGRLVAVFGWEFAHIGDPVEDLAYTGLPLSRGRDPKLSRCCRPRNFLIAIPSARGWS